MRARESRADVRFESIDQIMDDLKAGIIDAQQARVMMDAIKWQCGKEKALVYGDSKTVDLKNTDGSLKQTIDPKKLSDEALKSILAARVSDAE